MATIMKKGKFVWWPEVANEKVRLTEMKLIAVGLMIEKDAKGFCPVDTGRLRASISTNWTGSGKDRGETETAMAGKNSEEQIDTSQDGVGQPRGDKFEVVVGTNVRYAPFIEFGTSKMGNTPFLRAAFEKNMDLIKRLKK